VTFCGYNETIADGIRLLVGGMIEAIDAKSGGDGIADAVASELQDLKIMNWHLSKSAQADSELAALSGLNLFAQVIFTSAQVTDQESFHRSCHETCERLIELVKQTDTRHLRELGSGERSSSEAIALVAQWLMRGRPAEEWANSSA
jgi:hypothetical protein